jgi:4a-hydroxytetrahydrobiopterin dehydratase
MANRGGTVAQLLDDAAVDVALVSLPGWHRVDKTLVKDVPVDGDAADNLVAAVAKAADELNHHPVVDRSGGAVRFTVWTHSAGGITSKDVALAGRIEEAIASAAASPPA